MSPAAPTASSAAPDSAALEALSRKYRALCALRGQRDDSGERATRETLRELSREFPGSLRELDTLGAEELARRAEATARAAKGGPSEPWMAWIDAYHALMRATLFIKEHLSGNDLPDETARELAESASWLSGSALDAAFVHAVAAPPEGRIGIVVLREVARLFDHPTETIARTLFPVRRPSPYEL